MHLTTLWSVATLFASGQAALHHRDLHHRQYDYTHNNATPKNVPTTGYRSVMYFGSWDIYGRNFTITDLDAEKFTHLHYAFADVNNVTSEVFLTDPWADIQIKYPTDSTTETGNNLYGNFKQLGLLKKKHRKLKVLLSIGGWSYRAHFTPAVATPAGRKTFCTTATKLVMDLGLDGVDIDWEYPLTSDETTDIVDLLRLCRESLNAYAATYNVAKPLLVVATSAGPENYTPLLMKKMDKYLDYWNLMAYDFSGSYSPLAQHQSNLYKSKHYPDTTPYNADQAVEYYTDHLDSDKVVLGMPLYGRGFNNTDGPGKKFNGTGKGEWEAGVWDYNMLPLAGSTEHTSHGAGASWSYDKWQKLMISYDTPKNAEIKAHYIREKKLGGGMWWEASGDAKGERSLVGVVTRILSGNNMDKFDQSENTLSYPGSAYDNVKNGFPGE